MSRTSPPATPLRRANRMGDLFDHTQGNSPAAVDAALVGKWQSTTGAPIEIDALGTLFILNDDQLFTLSADDQTLTFPNTNPLWQFTRLTGSGSLQGLWERFEMDAGELWREEWLYRADGSFTYHFSVEGEFDSEGGGTYQATGNLLSTRERNSAIATGPNDQIVIAVAFGPVLTGSYQVAADGQSWTLDTGNGPSLFTKIP